MTHAFDGDDLFAPVSYGGGGGGDPDGGGFVKRTLSAGRDRALRRGGGYSDGGNFRTALDVNGNGRWGDEFALGVSVLGGPVVALGSRVGGAVVSGLGAALSIREHFR
jgi:hypothetical protein